MAEGSVSNIYFRSTRRIGARHTSVLIEYSNCKQYLQLLTNSLRQGPLSVSLVSLFVPSYYFWYIRRSDRSTYSNCEQICRQLPHNFSMYDIHRTIRYYFLSLVIYLHTYIHKSDRIQYLLVLRSRVTCESCGKSIFQTVEDHKMPCKQIRRYGLCMYWCSRNIHFDWFHRQFMECYLFSFFFLVLYTSKTYLFSSCLCFLCNGLCEFCLAHFVFARTISLARVPLVVSRKQAQKFLGIALVHILGSTVLFTIGPLFLDWISYKSTQLYVRRTDQFNRKYRTDHTYSK